MMATPAVGRSAPCRLSARCRRPAASPRTARTPAAGPRRWEARLFPKLPQLDVATAKLDALTTKTHDVWQTTHFTKGYLQNGIPTIFDMIYDTCWIASEARSAARYAAYGNPAVQTTVHPCS
jgi:hypothetical protein